MALDVATLPLILYRKVYVLLLCHSYSIFFISNVFSTCSCPFFTTLFEHNRYTIYTVNDVHKTIEHVLHCENIISTHSYIVSLLELHSYNRYNIAI